MEKEFKVIGGKSNKVLFENVKGTTTEILLMVAVEFPEEYFGCNVIGTNNNDFHCVAVEEFYGGETALEAAAKAMVYTTREKNGFYEETEDWNGDICRHYPPLNLKFEIIYSFEPTRLDKARMDEIIDNKEYKFEAWVPETFYAPGDICIYYNDVDDIKPEWLANVVKNHPYLTKPL